MELNQRLERLPVSRFHYFLLLTAGIAWMFDSMDTGIISFVLPVLMKSWRLTTEQVGTIGSMGLAGMALGAVFSGTIADMIGRKRVLVATLLTYSLATGLCGLAWNYGSLLFFRFLVGFGLGGQLPVAVTLVGEFSPAKYRGRFLVLLESFWAVGWLLAAVIAYLVIPTYGWSIAFFLGALPALYVGYLWRFVPESPRYLESHGRQAEAAGIVARIETQAGVTPPTEQVVKPAAHRQETKEAKFGLPHLFTRAYLKRTIFLWVLWFGIVFAYYGIFTWLPSLLALKGFVLTKNFSYILLMTLAQIPGYFSAAALVDKLGRKPTLVVYILGTAIFAYFFGQGSSNASILTMGCLMSFFNLGAWGIIYTYTPELYPTVARATGSGWAAGFGRIGGILAPLVVGAILGRNPSGYSMVFVMFTGVLLVVALNVLVLGEETRGRTLDEIAT